MTNQPWGPHGQEAPPNTVRQNPTAPGSPQQIQGADWTAAPSSAGSGGSGGFLVMILFSLFLVVLLWIPMVCLYPLTALAGGLAGFGTASLAARVLPPDGGDVADLLGVVAGAIVAWKVYRLEYRMAERLPFRLVRHVVRLLLLSVWVIPIIELSMGVTAPGTTTRYVLATVSNPQSLASFLTRPQNLAIWAVAIGALHLLLWKADGLRQWWHHRLKWVGLK